MEKFMNIWLVCAVVFMMVVGTAGALALVAYAALQFVKLF